MTIARRLFNLSAPIIGVNVLSVLTLAVDTAMCGRLADADVALKALGFAAQIVFLLMVAVMGLTVGCVAVVARAYGAGDRDRLNHVLAQSTQLVVLVGLGVALIGIPTAPHLLSALGASGDVVDAGMDYLRPMLGGSVFYYLVIMYGGVLRSVGNTRLPFFIALLSNAVNIVLNYGLILGNLGMPALGIEGAGIASVISFAVNVAVTIFVLRRGAVDNLHPTLAPRAVDRRLAFELYRIGAPAALDMLLLNVAFISIVGMIGRIDELAVAAHGIGLRIQALAFVPGLGVSQATAAMVGQSLGAENPDEARAVARASVALCTGLMTTLGLAIIAAAYPIVGIFDVPPGSPLESFSIEWMFLLGACMPIVGVHIAFVGVLQGAGATNTSLSINFVGTVIVQVPLSILLGFTLDLGAFGVWLSFPLSFVVKAALGWAAYKRGRWIKLGKRI